MPNSLQPILTFRTCWLGENKRFACPCLVLCTLAVPNLEQLLNCWEITSKITVVPVYHNWPACSKNYTDSQCDVHTLEFPLQLVRILTVVEVFLKKNHNPSHGFYAFRHL